MGQTPLSSSGRTLTGAWIETRIPTASSMGRMRRTLTGAWIETVGLCLTLLKRPVAPSRVRGLKQVDGKPSTYSDRRTLTGAWIETEFVVVDIKNKIVAPSRVRGLKHVARVITHGILESHPHG